MTKKKISELEIGQYFWKDGKLFIITSKQEEIIFASRTQAFRPDTLVKLLDSDAGQLKK